MGSLNEMARLVREELLTLIQPVTLLSVNPERSTGKITGRFRSSGMLFDYNIGGQTVSYKPVGAGRSARADAEAALSAVADAWEIVAELAQSRQDTRCQKPDGTIYGTRGKCKQGKELKKEQPQFTRRRTTQNWNRARATELQMRGTTALGRRVEAKGFVGSNRTVAQKAGGLRSNAGPTSLRRRAGTVGAGTRAGLAANAQQVERKRSRAASKGTQKTPKAPANPARDRYKELSGRARRRSPYASAETNRNAAGAKRSLESMVMNRGTKRRGSWPMEWDVGPLANLPSNYGFELRSRKAPKAPKAPKARKARKARNAGAVMEVGGRKYVIQGPALPPDQRGATAAKPKRKRKSKKTKIDLRKYNKPPQIREAHEKAAYDRIVQATKKRQEEERESRSLRSRVGRVRSAIGEKVNAAKQALATRRRDSYNDGYQEVMARLDWEG